MRGLMFAKPIVLPNVSPVMLNPEYWLERMKEHPKLRERQDLRANPEAFYSKPWDIHESTKEYRGVLERQKHRTVYNAAGEENAAWPDQIDAVNQALNAGFEIGCGLVVNAASLKFSPNPSSFFYEKVKPFDLDRNQLSGLEPGDKVIAVNQTPLNGYYPVACERGVGWVPARDIAFGPEALINSFLRCRHRRWIVDSKASLLGRDGLVPVSMGCCFPTYPGRDAAVLIPKRQPGGRLTFGKGIIAGESAPEPLPQSASHCIRQAFKYLGCHYAWGDENGEGRGRDCSRFVQDVMASMGIKVPRNSQDQFNAGIRRIDLRGCSPDKRYWIIASGSPGNLLFTDSHVMIYLGTVEQSLYVIHACYQYKEESSPEKERRIKQVVVSDLALGEGTCGGSLLERLTGMVEIF